MATITVTTAADITADDSETSLREAVDLANQTDGADQIVFDAALIAGETTIRLTQGELLITDEVSIDGAGMITVTGDANGDDGLVAGTDITDLAATDASQLDDNSRVFRIDVGYLDQTSLSGLTITGGRSDTTGLYGAEAPVSGGGGVNATGELLIENTILAGNSVNGRFTAGGGLSGDTVIIRNSTVSDNRTEAGDSSGGGLRASNLTMTGSTIVGNSNLGQSSNGGGLVAAFADIRYSTFSDNSAAGAYSRSGAFSIGNGALSGITVTGNFAARNGGGYFFEGLVANSIFLGNASSTFQSNDLTGYSPTISSSIIGVGTFQGDGAIAANPESVFAQTKMQNGALAGVLADNGGPVPTIALRAANENPALDAAIAGTGETKDQRGLPRSVDLASAANGGVSDLGAFELQADEFGENFDPVPPPPIRNTPTADPDVFFGGSQANTIFGRRGDDLLAGDLGADTIRGGGGEDTIIGGTGADLMAGGSDNDFLIGGLGADLLTGGRGDDLLHGEGGADRILGLAGNDSLRGAEGRDVLLGGAGDDLLQGAAGNDRLFGGDGDDTISGDGVRDDAGRDTIVGGAGDDQLSGFGGGRTEFVFREGDGSDDVFFFEQDTDKIRILSGAEEFEDLTIMRDQDDVIIRFADVQITIDDQRRIDFGEDDFLF